MNPFAQEHLLLYTHIHPSSHMHVCSDMQTKKYIHMPRYTYTHTHRLCNVFTGTLIYIYIYPTTYTHENTHTSRDRHIHKDMYPHTAAIIHTSIFTNTYPHIHINWSIWLSMQWCIHRDPYTCTHMYCTHREPLLSVLTTQNSRVALLHK